MKRTWLIKLREEQKLTQEQVAVQVNIKRSYYTMIENGKRRPSVEVAQRIGDVLKFNWTIFFSITSNEMILTIT